MKFNSLQDTYTLNNGVKIPIIGFGTWQTPDGEVAKESVLAALNAGYRHIDTAKAYGNEDSVGEAIQKSGINRHELFITTKLWKKLSKLVRFVPLVFLTLESVTLMH